MSEDTIFICYENTNQSSSIGLYKDVYFIRIYNYSKNSIDLRRLAKYFERLNSIACRKMR